MKYKKLGLFVTQVFKDELLLFTSRGLRKSLHQPQTISLWIAILFMVGASLFAFASLLSIYPSFSFSNNSINLTYFIGSIFFTSAAYLQYLESINSDITNKRHVIADKTAYLWFRFRPHNLGYISSLTQFIGTLFFNLNTFDTILNPANINTNNLLVWGPNILGSILFLVSAFFAWLEIFHDEHIKRFRSYTWWIIWVTILGSVFFLISSFYTFHFASGDNAFFDKIAIWTTLLGAVCFFIAALLLRFETNKQD